MKLKLDQSQKGKVRLADITSDWQKLIVNGGWLSRTFFHQIFWFRFLLHVQFQVLQRNQFPFLLDILLSSSSPTLLYSLDFRSIEELLRMSNLPRSVSCLLRASRISLQKPRGVNPVQHVFSQDRIAIRGMATAFERTKPHVNIGEHGMWDTSTRAFADGFQVQLVTLITERLANPLPLTNCRNPFSLWHSTSF